MEKQALTRPAALLERKKALGRLASYTVLAAMTGLSRTTVFWVLTEQASSGVIQINREAALDKIEKALGELEVQLDLAA